MKFKERQKVKTLVATHMTGGGDPFYEKIGYGKGIHWNCYKRNPSIGCLNSNKGKPEHCRKSKINKELLRGNVALHKNRVEGRQQATDPCCCRIIYFFSTRNTSVFLLFLLQQPHRQFQIEQLFRILQV